MTTVVIADDEKIIRAGIKKILGEGIPEALRVLEAKNGKEAYGLCTEESVHIVITDIRMPIMDGVQLMDALSALPEKPSIIVLSGYEEFSYAKAAISSGAVSYILKPINKAEFLAAVSRAIAVQKQSRRIRNEENLRHVLYGADDAAKKSIDKSLFARGVVCLAVAGSGGEEKLSSFLQQSGSCILEAGKNCLFVVTPADMVQALCAEPACGELSIGISSQSSSYMELKKLREESITALLNVFFRTDSRIFYAADNALSADFSPLDDCWEQCITAVQLLNEKKALSGLEKLFDFSKIPPDARAAALHHLYGKCTVDLLNRFPASLRGDTYLHAKAVMIGNIMQTSSLAEWKKYVTDFLLYLMSLLKKQNGDVPYIGQALAYLAAHYSDPDMTMATISNYVSVNYTWFSEKFKECTGQSFNDYLRSLRLSEAKKLIATGRYRVYEVAEKCGFKDPKHFAKAFKEETGVKPSEWIEARQSPASPR